MLVCLNCHWAGVSEDQRFGACPRCRGRKFHDMVEWWTAKLAWASLVIFLGYMATPVGASLLIFR